MKRLIICVSRESLTKYLMTSCEIKGKTNGKLVDLLKRSFGKVSFSSVSEELTEKKSFPTKEMLQFTVAFYPV